MVISVSKRGPQQLREIFWTLNWRHNKLTHWGLGKGLSYQNHNFPSMNNLFNIFTELSFGCNPVGLNGNDLNFFPLFYFVQETCLNFFIIYCHWEVVEGQNQISWNTRIHLTHWGWVTHICVSKLTTIGSDSGLSSGRCQAIIWSNAGILLIWPSGTSFSEISIEMWPFSL